MNSMFAIGIVQAPKLIRITRGEVLSLREENFVQAAIADGAPDRSVIFRHILPNAVTCCSSKPRSCCPSRSLPKRPCRSLAWASSRRRRRGA